MEQRRLGDKLLGEIVDAIKASKKQEEIKNYITEVAERCADLCYAGEELRVLNEYKMMMDNIRKELNF